MTLMLVDAVRVVAWPTGRVVGLADRVTKNVLAPAGNAVPAITPDRPSRPDTASSASPRPARPRRHGIVRPRESACVKLICPPQEFGMEQSPKGRLTPLIVS